MVFHRSTKGASKARRDHINHEIRNMRALLPISQEDQERLSYLHSMAAICTYIRKCVLFQGLEAGGRSDCCVPYEAFLEALHGFLLVSTAQGKLVYVSENVPEYLGLSMVDVLQGDTLYDLVERSDLDVVRTNLDTRNDASAERSFVCCMQTSKAFRLQHGGGCSMLVSGSFRFFPRCFSAASRSNEPLFVALCTPTANRSAHFSQSFSSAHGLDMSFTQTSESVLFLLGYSADEMSGRSWYSLVHPEDLSLAADSHRSLIKADEGFRVEMVLRLQGPDQSWTWSYIQATKDRGSRSISCTNVIISETQARFLRKTTGSDAFKPPSGSNQPNFAQQPSRSQNFGAKACKRPRMSNGRREEPGAGASRESEQNLYWALCTPSQGDRSPDLGGSPDLFTPPYSPTSSSSSLQQEELDHMSSPGTSPSCYSNPAAGFTCHQPPAEPPPRTTDQTFEDLLPSSSSLPPSPRDYDFPACSSDARLVPDSLSMSEMCELPAESLHPDDFDLLEHPRGGGLVQLQHVPHPELPMPSGLLTPLQSPVSTNHYSEREQEEISILAQQISSLASSFDLHHSLNVLGGAQPAACDGHHGPEPVGEHASMFESILKDLSVDSLSCPGTAPYQPGFMSGSHQEQEAPDLLEEDLLPEEQLCLGGIVVDPFSLQLGLHNLNTGLHQPNICTQRRLQPDGRAGPALY
ncbi:neuronal PAS domain-containing protein 4-like [Nematolebias whitei]|uniref:neuronal PAS domain-containing protein 4-like n=1 Tax=Nematolebias whitei TaxID=451745 RepID=UPI00189BF5E1|nr:neuronal PAS domain-containing protein 4-like [Nematolebias whitei]